MAIILALHMHWSDWTPWDRKVNTAITFAFHIHCTPWDRKVEIAITFAYTYIGHPGIGQFTLLSHLLIHTLDTLGQER